MRKLDRSAITPPTILVDENDLGFEETREAIKFFGPKGKNDPAVAPKKFEYSVYRNPAVKAKLAELSNNMCSYCESNALAGYDGDIEHFRPKGEVHQDGIKLKPGYYWLAAKWENLLLSCVHCNQHRVRIKGTGGKANQFPLSDKTKRVKSPDTPVSDEEPYRLLLDPCVDDPSRHLAFDDRGIITAATDDQGVMSARGRVTIDVFVLYRTDLSIARQEQSITINAELESITDDVKYLAELINANTAQPQIDSFRALLDKKVQKLNRYFRPGQTYTEMAFQIINRFLEKNGIPKLTR